MNPIAANPAARAGADPLAELRGIHLPSPVGLWPLAPGWWILLALVATALVASVVLLRRRRRSLGRNALRELDALARRYVAAAEVHPLAAALSELLRRVALVRFGRQVASLHGAAWETFLGDHGPRGRRAARRFPLETGRLLALAPYAPPACLTSASAEGSPVDRDRLLAAARNWIRWNT